MSNKTGETGVKVYTSRPWELVKTGFLVITWIILGSHLELVGSTINILASQTGVSYSDISAILIARSAGYLSGNVVGALVQKLVKQYPEGLLSIAFLIASIVVLATPFIRGLFLLSTLFFFQGISQGVTDLGGTSLMLTMWGDYVSAPLSVVHLGYGFGAELANSVVKPFIVEDKNENKTSMNSTSTISIIEKSNIETPYSIIALLCFLISIGHLIFSICEYRKRRAAIRNREVNYSSVSTTIVNETNDDVKITNVSQYSPRSWGNGYFNYGLSMAIIWVFYMFFLSGNDQSFGKYFITFLKSSEYRLSTADALWVMNMYWRSYTVGRLICVVITIFVPVHIVLSGLWVCGLMLAFAWYIFVWHIGLTSTNLLILGAFTGLVFSPTFPLSFGFINQRLNANPLLIGLLLCGSSVGAMLFQKIGGNILDEKYRQYRQHFPTILITCVILTVIFFVIALIISSIHQKKVNSNKNSNPISDNKHQLNISEEEIQMENYLTHNEHDKQ